MLRDSAARTHFGSGVAVARGRKHCKKGQNNGQATGGPDPNTSSAEKCSQDSDPESSLGDSAVERDKRATALGFIDVKADVQSTNT